MKPVELIVAKVVTRDHGRVFARELIRQVWDSGVIVDAFGVTALMKWPDHDAEAQGRYQDIKDEIVEKTLGTSEARNLRGVRHGCDRSARPRAKSPMMRRRRAMSGVVQSNCYNFR